MIRSYFITAFRNFQRHPQNNLLNLAGLAIGICTSIFIFLYINAEISYEKSYPGYSLIYRLASTQWAKSSPPACEEIKNFIPQIDKGGRLAQLQNLSNVIVINKQHYPVNHGYFADQEILDIFSRRVLSGDPGAALTLPFTLVLTKTLSEKIFGDADPVGKSVKFATGQLNESPSFEISAVIEDFPPYSHLKIDFLISMPTFYKFLPEEWSQSRTWMVMYTYLSFRNQNDATIAASRLYDFQVHYLVNDNHKEEIIRSNGNYYELHPLSSIHLTSHREQEMGVNGDISYVYVFGGLAILILLVASANFINIYITQSLNRSKEVGIRKVTGAHKSQVVQQFIFEAYLYSLLAGVIALIFCGIFLPVFNRITNLTFTTGQLFSLDHLIVVLILILIVGLLSGGYPAYFISGFKISDAIKINKIPDSSLSLTRKTLIIFQFVIAIFMIISSIVIYRQLNYLRNKDLGFDRENIIAVHTYGDFNYLFQTNRPYVYQKLLSQPGIISAGATSNLMGNIESVEYLLPDGMEYNRENQKVMRFFRADEGFIPTMSIELISGRNFDAVRDSSAAFIINETAVRSLELDNPVGRMATNTAFGTRGEIVGVMKDFNFASLHEKIEPLVLTYRPEWASTILVKAAENQIEPVLKYIHTFIDEEAPGSLFYYEFIDDNLNGLYRDEDKMKMIFTIFSLLAVLISCVGLYGVAAYTSELRTKEIGIRKAFGASSLKILLMLFRSYISLIVIALVIAVPLSNYFNTEWMQSFAYHVDIGWWIFLFSGLLVMITALVAVSTRSIHAAGMNPAKSLRSE